MGIRQPDGRHRRLLGSAPALAGQEGLDGRRHPLGLVVVEIMAAIRNLLPLQGGKASHALSQFVGLPAEALDDETLVRDQNAPAQ